MKITSLTPVALALMASASLHAANAPAASANNTANAPAAPASAPAASTVIKIKPYLLDTCIVSGDKIGSMGKPVVIIQDGNEIKFCCNDCPKDFAKDTAKYMKMIADAEKKLPANATTVKDGPVKPYPLDYSIGSGDKLAGVAKPIVVIYNGQEIKFAKKSDQDAFNKDPMGVLQKIADAQKKP